MAAEVASTKEATQQKEAQHQAEMASMKEAAQQTETQQQAEVSSLMQQLQVASPACSSC